VGSSWTSTPRTRASRPDGSSTSWSPRPIVPDHSVPVTTVPAPRIVNTRSTWSLGGAPSSARDGASAATVSSAARSSSSPAPVRVLVATARTPGSSSPASAVARAGSARSAFVIATTPRSTPRLRSTLRCSTVWGITPSSAAIVMRKRSMPVAPATIVRTKRSWPGTSTTDSRRPDGRTRAAKPRSIEMPRSRSSGRRSVSTPVSSRISAVLP